MAGRMRYKTLSSQLNMFDLETPSMSVLDVSRCEAKIINYETAARMVETYHYAHRVPSIVIAIGMYVDNILAGCITYGMPSNRSSLSFCGDQYIDSGLELNRLFVHNWAGQNSESWLIGQSIKMIPDDYKILISYADTEYGHLGIVYQATNWIYTGLSERGGYQADVIYNGERLSPKAMNNRYGTIALDGVEKCQWFPKHRYVYFLGNKQQRRELRKALKWPVLPYPKIEQARLGLKK